MAEFSIMEALNNSGMDSKDITLIFICWKTSPEVYQWLKDHNYHYADMVYDEGKGFIWNLYKGWNLGYTEGYKYADFVCPIATDHAFYKNWLLNMMNNAKPNRIVNCKLIEPGTLPSLHTCKNFGITTYADFKMSEFNLFCDSITKDELVLDDKNYGHRLDAMPFVCPKDVWQRFGPMSQIVQAGGLTGDTDFFNRCKEGGVEITKSLNGISYHCGGLETRRNEVKNVYT
jgi:hypothetical protein